MYCIRGFQTFLTQGTPVNNLLIQGTPGLHYQLLEFDIRLRYVNMHIVPPEIRHITEKELIKYSANPVFY